MLILQQNPTRTPLAVKKLSSLLDAIKKGPKIFSLLYKLKTLVPDRISKTSHQRARTLVKQSE